MGIRSQKLPTPMLNTKIAQDVFEETEMFSRFTQKCNASLHQIQRFFWQKQMLLNSKKPVDVYVLQPKADHQCSKISLTDFRLNRRHIVEKALPNNKYLVHNTGTDKTQVLHCTLLRPFTPMEPTFDVYTTSQEWKLDLEVIIKHEDL